MDLPFICRSHSDIVRTEIILLYLTAFVCACVCVCSAFCVTNFSDRSFYFSSSYVSIISAISLFLYEVQLSEHLREGLGYKACTQRMIRHWPSFFCCS